MSIRHSILADGVGVQTLAAGRTVVHGAAAIVAAPFVAIVRLVRINRTNRQLAMLDDRTLADIGLRRMHILSTATEAVDWPHLDPRRFSR